MKNASLWVLLIFSGACCFAWLSSVWADGPDDPPEFSFTRLAYSENPTGCCRHRGSFRGFGGRGSPTMPIPPQFVCPEFGGRNFFPRQGWGWGTDYPGGDCKFMGGIHRLTGMRVAPNPHVIGAMDPDLFKFPFLYAVEVGGMYFNTQDAARIREYLLRGGFFYVDDFWGGAERENFEAQMTKVFPERQMEALPLNHQIFHTFFDIESIMQVPGQGDGCYGGRAWEGGGGKQPRGFGIEGDNGPGAGGAPRNTGTGAGREDIELCPSPAKHS